MSETTRQKIASTIESIGYQPNDIARSLRRQESKTISVIMVDIFNPYSMDVLRSIEEYCSQEGYKIFVCDAKKSGAREHNYIEEMVNRGVDDFILNTIGENDLFIKRIHLEHPVVLIGRKIKKSNISSVGADNVQGVKYAITVALSITSTYLINSLVATVPSPSDVSLEGDSSFMRDLA